MKLSVIVPAHKAEATLPRTLESLNVAAKKWSAATGFPLAEAEIIVSWDPEGRGPSWARNRGLEKAKGDYVFFCDADDTVRSDFFLHPIGAMDRTGAQMCLFGFNDFLPRRDYDLVGNDAVRRVFLPTVFGYSFDDVRRWNAGGRLWDSREWAMVWRTAYRREFLEQNGLMFDEDVKFCEDAMFLSSCAVRCERFCSVGESLYDYHSCASGLLSVGLKSDVKWNYKFSMLEFRKRLDREFGGLWQYCEASTVFSALELFRSRKGFLRYVQDPLVVKAFEGFPTSVHHPLIGVGVHLCGFLARRVWRSGGR